MGIRERFEAVWSALPGAERLPKSTSVNSRNRDGATPLIVATENHCAKAPGIQNDSRAEWPHPFWRRLISAACRGRVWQVAAWLAQYVETGPDPAVQFRRTRDEKGNSSLHL